VTSRVAIVLAAELALIADVDPRAPGGEVTVALCGSWEHDGPCRWPHNTAIDSDTNPAQLRTVVLIPDAEQDDVASRVERALRADARWMVVAFATKPLAASEHALAGRLASVAVPPEGDAP
jgi:hypothetical protein